MANERLYQFPSKASPTPSDIVYVGDAANSFDEVNCTIAQLISAYPNLSSYATLTLGANSYSYTNNSSVVTAGTITALGVSLLADSTIASMQTTLGRTATPSANLFASWDNNSNLSSNRFLSGYATTVTAAATTTLSVTSAYQQFFTGSTTQTVLMPVTSTLVLGDQFYIVNNSSGVVTVESSGGNTIQAMAANTTLSVTCVAITGTTAASWYADYNFQSALSLPLSIANGGTAVSSVTIAPTATSWAGWDANKNMSAVNFIEGYTTTATAGGTTTLTVGSNYQQFFTGSTTQTVIMPVTSTLVLGQQWYLVNNSTGAVTVQSSGANTILTMAANTTATITCILTSGTTAASWFGDYQESSLALPVSLVNGGTNAALTASNGGIIYSTASAMAVLAGTATAGLFLQSGATGAPSWSNMSQSNIVTAEVNGRLTLTSGNPVTTTDVTAATTVYFTPYKGDFIDLYDGSSIWNRIVFSEISISVPATTNTMYDVFCFNNSGTATLELTAWTDTKTRATALTTQNGVYVKTGATTRRYLGSFSTTAASGQTEDSKANRLLFNYYNRVLRALANATETTNSWAYSSSTLRQANGNAANCLNVNIGVSEDTITARVFAMAQGNTTGTQPAVGIGIDSTTVNSAQIAINNAQEVSATGFSSTSAEWVGYPGVGNHQLNWLESNISNANTVTWFGDNNNPPTTQSGMVGTFMM